MVIVFEIFSTTGGFTAGFLSDFIPSHILTIILIIVLILIGMLMLAVEPRMHKHADDGSWYLWHRRVGKDRYVINLLSALPLCVLAGVLSALTGIGGGIVKVPMMTLLFGVPMDIAIACSALMVGVTAASSFAGHVIVGHWDWKISLILAPCVFVGAWIGAHIMLKVDKRKLKKIFGILVIIIAALLIFRIF